VPKPQQTNTLVALKNVNLNALVFIIQTRLKDSGSYSGKLSGTLSSATLKSIAAFCKANSAAKSCSRAPQDQEGLRELLYHLVK
jgi:hypothetical protein